MDAQNIRNIIRENAKQWPKSGEAVRGDAGEQNENWLLFDVS